MKIVPLAADSMGTRSMATYIETGDCKIVIDAAVALGPYRYGHEPHPLEHEMLDKHWKRIKWYARRADVLIVTHYHYDHHDPDEPGIYRNKTLLTKHPKENINKSQKKRASFFLKELEDLPKKIEFSDGNEFSFGKTKIRFSKAVPHGTSTKLGCVTEVCIREGREKFLHTSDVQGPCLDEQADFILDEKPRTVFCDGPMSYMLGYRYSKKSLEVSIENIIRIMKETRVKNFVVDHHLLRDLKWDERLEDAFVVAKERNVTLSTFAGYLGKENEILEARRKELWRDMPTG